MSPTDDRVEEIFHAALDISDRAARDALIVRECKDDLVLEARVRRLLEINEDETGLLEGVPLSPELQAELARLKPEETGERIGRYRLLQQIGEGGFGVVWMAEQEEPMRRRVALKIIKLGMDTKEVIARFEQERQALAMMDHPNIAKVFDAGATQFGRPFFVMELVHGIKITDYCDQANLPTPQRLELFIQVCQAVQHAHQKGIIHRDLKPSNVLVTLHNGVPTPKVIDFGVAKATQSQRLTDLTLITQFEQMIGTPAYMSPEQAEMSGLDIDTRSDIYSLGVLLYELLTGKTPFDSKTLLASGLDEMRRRIREDEPVRPSTRVSTMADAERTSVAKRRQSDAARLIRLFRGDLDWIVMKTLEKDRTRRYETASALATDLSHFLNLEPVSAVAPNATYRIRKFIRRNRAAVAMVASFCGLLLCGVTIITWLAIQARANRVAIQEARRAIAVSRLLQEMLEAVQHARAPQDVVMLRGILDAAAARMSVELRDQPEAEVEMRRIIGRTYEALGLLDLAEPMQRAAVAAAVRLHGRHHTTTAFALAELGFTLRLRSEFTEATNLLQEALTILQQQLGENHAEVAGPLHRLGSVYTDLGRYKEAAPLLTRAVEIRQRTRGAEARLTLDAELDLATLYYREGRLAEAESRCSRLLEIQLRVFGEDDPRTPDVLELLAFVRQDQGRFVEAEGLLSRLIETKRRLLLAEHPFTLTIMNNLAMVYGYQGRYAEAEQLCRKAMESYSRQLSAEHRNTLAMQSNLAEYLRNQRRFTDAEALFRQVMKVQRRTMPVDDPFRLETENSLAVQYFMQGRNAEAEPLLTNILQRRRASLAADDPALADALAQVTLLLLAQEKFAEAEPLAGQCLAIQTQRRPGTWQQSAAQSQLGGCLLGLHRNGEAEPLLVQAAEGLKQQEATIPMIDQTRLREAFERLLQLYQTTDRPDEASRWRQELERVRTDATSLPSKP